MAVVVYPNGAYLMHHGVKGMKWGVRRTPAQLGYGAGVRGGSNRFDRMKAKLRDPDFQRKVKTGAKIAVAVAAIYATHKVINDPRALEAGKKLMDQALIKSGAMKASVVNSTEFKVLSAAKEPAVKTLKLIKSDDFSKTVTGIGAMAATAKILKGQIKDFKEKKPEGDTVDKALDRTQQLSSMAENVNKLAQGPKGQTGGSSSSSSSSNSLNNSTQNVSVFTDTRTGQPIRANRKLGRAEKDKIKAYRAAHPNMTLSEALDELGWLDKDAVKHSGMLYVPSGAYILKVGNVL